MNIEQRVYKKLLQVPTGCVVTYGELSRAVRLHNGQRLVGQIMKKNPFHVIVPCHSVVKSVGSIGGYAFGENIKKKMLLNEGVETNKNKNKNFQENKFQY